MKPTFVISLLLVILSPVVFSQRKSRPKAKVSTPTKTSTKPSVKKDEVVDEITKTWDAYFIRCGDSYYMKAVRSVCESKFISMPYEERPVTEADRLNGIARRVVSRFDTKAERCQRGTGWEEWHAGSRFSVELVKKSGIWTAGTATLAGTFALEKNKLACTDIPK